MLNSVPRTRLIIGGWLSIVAVALLFCIATGASFSTCVVVLVVGAAPAVVAMLIAGSAPSPSVAEILQGVDDKDRR